MSLKNGQLVIKLPEVEKNINIENLRAKLVKTIPIEDIGVVVLDHKEITITQALMTALLDNKAALIGHVVIMCITDKQFADIKVFYCKKQERTNAPYQQLELF